MRGLDWKKNESRALWENRIAPEQKAKRSKTQKNKPWTDKETNIFAAVLSSTESRDKPFALVLETMALEKTANESVFNHVREEFEDMLVAEGITAYFGNTRNSQARSVFCWLGNHAHLAPVPRRLNPS